MNLLVDARRAMLEGILDFTGLTESCPVSLEQAVAKYREAVLGSHGWMVGRFISPTSRLEELVAILTVSMQPGERPWHVGVAIDEPLGAAAMHASVFHTYMDPAGSVTSIETTADDIATDALATAAAGISSSTTAFVNVRLSADDSVVAHLADAARSRLQPVGALLDLATEASKPIPLAEALMSSTQSGVPLKVHSLPSGSAASGLLRLLVAAALAHKNAPLEKLITVLSDDEPDTITATAIGLRWEDELFGVPDIKNARSTLRSWNCHDLDTATTAFAQRGLLVTKGARDTTPRL